MRPRSGVYVWPPASPVQVLRAPSPSLATRLLAVYRACPGRPLGMVGRCPVNLLEFSVCAALGVAELPALAAVGASSQVGVLVADAKEAGAYSEAAAVRGQMASEFGLVMQNAAFFRAPVVLFSTKALRLQGSAGQKAQVERDLQPRRHHRLHPSEGGPPSLLAGGSEANSVCFAEVWARGAADQTRSGRLCSAWPHADACARRNRHRAHFPHLPGTLGANQPRFRAAAGTAWSGHG